MWLDFLSIVYYFALFQSCYNVSAIPLNGQPRFRLPRNDLVDCESMQIQGVSHEPYAKECSVAIVITYQML